MIQLLVLGRFAVQMFLILRLPECALARRTGSKKPGRGQREAERHRPCIRSDRKAAPIWISTDSTPPERVTTQLWPGEMKNGHRAILWRFSDFLGGPAGCL